MSWKRFEEFKNTKIDDEDKKQQTKRKSLDGYNGKVVKKRRRSLCFSYSSTNICDSKVPADELGPHKKKTLSTVPKDDNIEDFSSSEEEEKPLVIGSLLEKPSNCKRSKESRSGARNDSREVCAKWSGEKQKVSSVFTPKSRSAATFEAIDWSESEEESQYDTKLGFDRKSQLLQQGKHKQFEALNDIEKFDSPIKDEIRNSSQISTIESLPSPIEQLTAGEIKREIPENTNDYLTMPFDSSKKKRKDINGGLVSQLRKIISRENSELVFWRHLSDTRNNSEKCLVSDAQKALLLRILSKDVVFSISVLQCQTLEDAPKELYVLIPNSKNLKFNISSQDMLLKIHQPWRKMELPNIKAPVLICVYFFEIVSDLSEIYKNDILLDFGDIETERVDKSNCISECENIISNENDLIHQNAELRFTKDFANCKFWRDSSFSAVVRGVHIYTTNQLPVLPGSEIGLVEFFQNSFAGRKQKITEVMLLLEDRNNAFAVLSLPFSLLKDILNSVQLSNLEGCTVNFKEFILTSVKSTYSDPVLFSLVRHKMRERMTLIGDVIQNETDICFVFSCGQNSLLSLVQSTAVQSENSIVKQESTRENINDSKRLSDALLTGRVSLYAHCICTVPDTWDDSLPEACSVFIAVLKTLPYYGQNEEMSRSFSKSIWSLRMLPSFYIPSFIAENLMESKIIFLQDILLEASFGNKLTADKYSKIFFVDSKDNAEDVKEAHCNHYKYITKEELKALNEMPLNIFEHLSNETDGHSIVLVSGEIIGIDSENAYCWKICSVCHKEPEDSQAKTSRFFCANCNDNVESKICVQLEVFLKNMNLVNCSMHVKLLEKTIFHYLPSKIGKDFEGFDVGCILGRKFGPAPCFVKEKIEDTKENEIRIFLNEVNLAKRFSGQKLL